MSLVDRIAAFDDDALAALANRGVLRRAQKAFAASEAKVVRYGADSAEVMAGGQRVTIPSDGPTGADCDCPATGACSHILLAVLALRSTDPADGATPQVVANIGTAGATDAIVALAPEAVAKVAGVDLSAALTLAPLGTVQDGATTVTVAFAAPQAEVTFVAGQGIGDALYKGPVTRRRLVVAAAAILLRDRAGAPRPDAGDAPAASGGPTPDLLDAAEAAILAAPAQVFHGAGALAAERLFDVAIGLRADTAPRLSATLLRLSAEAEWAAVDDIRFDGARFLSALARGLALVHALRARPEEDALNGRILRDYAPCDAMNLLVLGADSWRTAGGARGLTVHGWCPGTGRFHAGVAARGPGMDPAFDSDAAYRLPFWDRATPKELMGRQVRFAAPHVSDDGQISLRAGGGASAPEPIPTAAFRNSGLAIVDWARLRQDIAARTGSGLTRTAAPIPAVIAPTRIGPQGFDDMDQVHHWTVLDRSGNGLRLTLPPDRALAERGFQSVARDAVAILVGIRLGGGPPVLRPLSLLSDDRGTLKTHVLQFDATPQQTVLGKAKQSLRSGLQRAPEPPAPAPLAAFAARVLDILVDTCRRRDADSLRRAARGAEARQLLTLADALVRVPDGGPSDMLRAAYLASEVLADPASHVA